MYYLQEPSNYHWNCFSGIYLVTLKSRFSVCKNSDISDTHFYNLPIMIFMHFTIISTDAKWILFAEKKLLYIWPSWLSNVTVQK